MVWAQKSVTAARLVVESTAMLEGRPPGPVPTKELLLPLVRSVVRIVSGLLQPLVKSENTPTPVRVTELSSNPPRPGTLRPESAADVSNTGENVFAGMFDV